MVKLDLKTNIYLNKKVNALNAEIKSLSDSLYQKNYELEQLSVKNRLLRFGNCFIYLSQHDQINKNIDGDNISNYVDYIIESFFIDVRQDAKEFMGTGSIEYFVDYDGSIKFMRANYDTSD